MKNIIKKTQKEQIIKRKTENKIPTNEIKGVGICYEKSLA